MEPLARLFVLLGVVFLVLGLWLHWGPAIPHLGRLPGDFRIERPGLRIHLPLASGLLVSVVLSLLLSLLSKLR